MIALRWNTFSRSLLFAVFAAGAALPWWMLARPFLGGARALAAYMIFVTAAYLAGLATERGRRAVTLAIALLAGGTVSFFARSFTELALGLGVILAVGRSAFLYSMPPSRAVVIELAITGGGLLFARFLAGGSALALVLAPWGFFLVQSLYFLVGGVSRRTGSGAHPDPFQDAYGRALSILERNPV